MARIVRTPKQARAKRTFRKIVDTAREQFIQQTYEEVTCAKIAKSAGIGVGTLYGYFRDKNEILLRIFAEENQRLGELVEPVIFDKENHPKPLKEFLGPTIEAVIQKFRDEGSLFYSIEQMVSKDESFREVRMRWERVAIDFLKNAMVQMKSPLADENLEMNAYIIHQMMYGSVRKNLMYGFNHDTKYLARQLERVIFAAVEGYEA